MASLNQRFGNVLRSNGRSLFANTAIDWPDFSLAQDLQYQTEDAVLSEVYDIDPLRMHASFMLGIALAQGRPYIGALYENQMKAVQLPPQTIQQVMVSAAAHRVRPWLVFESNLLNTSDPSAVSLQATHDWLSHEAAFFHNGEGKTISPVACIASASTRNSQWNTAASAGIAITPQRCLQRAVDLNVPARVVYDGDHRNDWLEGVRLLVLDSVRCLPRRTIQSIVAWASSSGGKVLASADSGLCDGLGRDLPQPYTLMAQLGAAATVANLFSSDATTMLRAEAWMAAPPASARIIVPHVFPAHLTVFVLCGEAGGCATTTNFTLEVPCGNSTPKSARLTAVANTTGQVVMTPTDDGVRLDVHGSGNLPQDFALIVSLEPPPLYLRLRGDYNRS